MSRDDRKISRQKLFSWKALSIFWNNVAFSIFLTGMVSQIQNCNLTKKFPLSCFDDIWGYKSVSKPALKLVENSPSKHEIIHSDISPLKISVLSSQERNKLHSLEMCIKWSSFFWPTLVVPCDHGYISSSLTSA